MSGGWEDLWSWESSANTTDFSSGFSRRLSFVTFWLAEAARVIGSLESASAVLVRCFSHRKRRRLHSPGKACGWVALPSLIPSSHSHKSPKKDLSITVRQRKERLQQFKQTFDESIYSFIYCILKAKGSCFQWHTVRRQWCLGSFGPTQDHH